MKEKIIIRDIVGLSTKILTGRQTGEKSREQVSLDKKDMDDKSYEVIIDNNFKSLNSSYWLGMFGDSVRKLGEEKFREKYCFICKDIFMDTVNRCITHALKVKR